MPTKVEWATESWNPVSGCDKISEGCQHCYAERMSKRLAGRFGYDAHNPFKVTAHPDKLYQPNHWRKPRRVFVCSMGDLFHSDVTWPDLGKIFNVMVNYKNRHHTFLILTKRAERMREFVTKCYPGLAECSPHIWLGVTAENQRRADERIPILLQIPAAVRFVSVEPMLGPVDLGLYGTIPHSTPYALVYERLHWVICGAETGPGARPMDLDWARSLRDQCISANVPFFFKKDSQGDRLLDGQLWEQYPCVSSSATQLSCV